MAAGARQLTCPNQSAARMADACEGARGTPLSIASHRHGLIQAAAAEEGLLGPMELCRHMNASLLRAVSALFIKHINGTGTCERLA